MSSAGMFVGNPNVVPAEDIEYAGGGCYDHFLLRSPGG